MLFIERTLEFSLLPLTTTLLIDLEEVSLSKPYVLKAKVESLPKTILSA